jgi:hypothetical protein
MSRRVGDPIYRINAPHGSVGIVQILSIRPQKITPAREARERKIELLYRKDLKESTNCRDRVKTRAVN